MRYDTSDAARLEVVSLGLAELGSTNPEPYWEEVWTHGPPYPRHWCGAFALRNLRLADLCDWHWLLARRANDPSGFLFRLGPPRGWRPGDPFDGSVFDVGDIAYFAKNQHHAHVWGWHKRKVRLLQGNGAGGAVTTSLVDVADVTAFYSLHNLVDRFDKEESRDEP